MIEIRAVCFGNQAALASAVIAFAFPLAPAEAGTLKVPAIARAGQKQLLAPVADDSGKMFRALLAAGQPAEKYSARAPQDNARASQEKQSNKQRGQSPAKLVSPQLPPEPATNPTEAKQAFVFSLPHPVCSAIAAEPPASPPLLDEDASRSGESAAQAKAADAHGTNHGESARPAASATVAPRAHSPVAPSVVVTPQATFASAVNPDPGQPVNQAALAEIVQGLALSVNRVAPAGDVSTASANHISEAPAALDSYAMSVAPRPAALTAPLAFTARLRPAADCPAPKAAELPMPAVQHSEAAHTEGAPDRPAAADAPVKKQQPARETAAPHPTTKPQDRPQQKTEDPEAAARAATPVKSQTEPAAPPTANATQAGSVHPFLEPPPVSRTQTPRPEAPAPSTTAAIRPAAEDVAKPAPQALQLSVNENGQRIDLRVTERAGDIHVAVRTPDSQLAAAMRENLPALSSKLEQSGLRGELWHPTSPGDVGARRLEIDGGASSSNAHQDHDGRRHQDESQQEQKQARQSTARKNDRKEFSWLFESMR